jgi:hypothetical protein
LRHAPILEHLRDHAQGKRELHANTRTALAVMSAKQRRAD